jgi:hypothetical protein
LLRALATEAFYVARILKGARQCRDPVLSDTGHSNINVSENHKSPARVSGANAMLILTDSGGSNGCRARAWKLSLQEKLCDESALTVTVCHYPTGCSKWNPVEHRLFSFISKNWEGKPLRTLEIMLGYIRGTRTVTGLSVKAFLDEDFYARGRRVTSDDIEGLRLKVHTVSDGNETIELYHVDGLNHSDNMLYAGAADVYGSEGDFAHAVEFSGSIPRAQNRADRRRMRREFRARFCTPYDPSPCRLRVMS